MNPNDPSLNPGQPEQPSMPPLPSDTESTQPPVAPVESQAIAPTPQPPQQAFVSPQPQQYQQAPQQPAGDVGKGLGIAGFILAFLVPPAGLVISIIARVKSNKAHVKNGLALAGIIVSSAMFVLMLAISLLTFVAYVGIQDRATGVQGRANAQTAQTTALSVAKMAEMYNAENGDPTTPKYPKTFSDIASMLPDVTLAASPLTDTPTDPKIVTFYACGDQTGNKVGYWDYVEGKVAYEYAGDATEASTDCTLLTQ
jgi:hypothetical protein